MIFRQLLSASLIVALLFPDVARCMENEEQNTQIVIKKESSDSDSSDLSPQKSPRSNESSSEELHIPSNTPPHQEKQVFPQKNSDSHSPGSSDEFTLSLTPSPEKKSNVKEVIPQSIASQLILPKIEEVKEKDPKVITFTSKEELKELVNKPQTPPIPIEKKEKNKTVFEIIELEDEKEGNIPSSTTKLSKIVGFLKEHFPKQAPPKEKHLSKSHSINNEEFTETSPLIVDLEKCLPSKASFLREALLKLLTCDEEKTEQGFKEWRKLAAQNNLIDELKALCANTPLLENIAQELEELIEESDELKKLTVQVWLDYIGLSEEDKKDKTEEPLKAALQLYDLFSQAVASHVAHKLFMEGVENMDDDVKSFLSYLQKHKIEAKLTKTQWGLVVLGVITAIGNSIAQGTVFVSGVKQFFKKLLDLDIGGHAAIGLSIEVLTTVISFIDSLPRDIEECVKLGESNQKAFSSRSKSILPYVLALFPTALAFYFFFNIEWGGIKYAIKHGQSTGVFWAYLGCLGPWLAFDALLTSASQLKDVKVGLGKKWNRVKGWLNTTWLGNVSCLKKVLKQQPLSESEIKKKEFIKSFKEMKESVFLMSDDTIDHIYDDLEQSLFKKKETVDTDELNAADAFILLSTFMKHFQPLIEEAQEDEAKPCISQTWKDRLATGLGVFFAGVASFARYAIYQYIMEYFLSSTGITNKTTLDIGSNFLGLIAFLIQGFVEERAVEENLKDVTSGKHGPHSVHPKASRGVGVLSFIVGLYYTLPSLVAGWIALQKHSIPMQALALVPYVFTDAHSTAWSLKDNYWSYYEALPKKTGICCGKLSSDAKKYKIMTALDHFMALSQNADPKIIMKLDQMLEKFNQTGFLNTKAKTNPSSQIHSQSSVEMLDINTFHVIEEEKK